MSYENTIHNYIEAQGTLPALDRLRVEGVNILQMHGQQRDSGIDAQWNDDAHYRFLLHAAEDETNDITYVLRVFEQYGNGDEIAAYEFYSNDDEIKEEFDDGSWAALESSDREDAINLLVTYLESGRSLRYKEYNEFMLIMASNEVFEQKHISFWRRFGSAALEALGVTDSREQRY